MNRSHFWKLLLILFIVGWSLYSQLPWKSRDLLKVFQEEAVNPDPTFSNIVFRAEQLQKTNAARPFGNLREAVGTNDLTKYFKEINVKNEEDPNLAVLYWVQRQAAGKIRLGLDLQGGTSFLVEMDTNQLARTSTDTNRVSASYVEDRKKSALTHAVEVLRKRVDKLGVAEPLLQPEGNDRILIQLPGLAEADKDQAKRVIQKAAFLTIRMVHPDSDKLIAEGITSWPGYVLMREIREQKDGTKTSIPMLVNKAPERGLTGKYIKHARVSRDQFTNNPEILFELNDEGAKIFEDITREFAPKNGKYFLMAIVLDDVLYSAPRINEVIPGGHVRISGTFTDKEAFELANVLENPLEAPVKIIEENSVDPTLGADSIRSGITACIIGTLLVSLFMACYYLMSGVVANIALISNIIILLGVMCAINTTLTLPGIAGVVLTVGMAVDANVLIYERIREEKAKGKSLRGALVAGYDRAFGTILDSHVTTLISSVILVWMGTGSVKGFGVALTIGVAASLFTALVVTRLIFDFALFKGWITSLKMFHLIRTSKIDFMRWALPAFLASWTLIAVGIGRGLYRGNDVLGVEFTGGNTVIMEFAITNKVPVDKLRDTISKLKVGDVMIQYQRDLVTQKENLRVTTRDIGAEKTGPQTSDAAPKVVEDLIAKYPDAHFRKIGEAKVGATVGQEIQKTAIVASLVAMLGILIYVAFRYEFSFAVGAIVAVIHDIFMTLGWYFLNGRELNATTVAAVLTIIGFSMNDTVVIFDRIREDLRMGVRGTFKELINQALNQTLSRTIITSGTVFLSTMSLYLFGGGAVNDFAFCFLVGIITGTYSSIYIASALVLWWHKGGRPKLGASVAIESAGAPVRA